MSSDTWKGGLGYWSVAANWTAGVPTSTSAVTVATGEAQAIAAIDIASLVDTATVDFISAGASTISGGVVNEGFLNIDAISGSGGSSLTSSGSLRNTGVVQLGASDNSLAASDTVKFATINNNFGELDLNGGLTAAKEMKLDITGAAGFGVAGEVLGDVSLTGHSVIEFASGQITTVGSGATLTLNGASAFLADASNLTANSALSGLSFNAGVLNLINGATVTTGALHNINEVYLDSALGSAESLLTVNGSYDNNGITGVGAQSVGGGLMVVDGVLVNDDEIDIGQTGARRSSTLTVNRIVNNGEIDIASMTPTAALSLLKVESAASFGQAGQLAGYVYLTGDSEVQFTSGAISQIDQAAYLELEGPTARIADASAQTTNSALTGLSTILGTFELQSGAIVAISDALNIGSLGELSVDADYALNEYGGSVLTVADALHNQGVFQLGDDFLTTASTASVGALNNSGQLLVLGSFSAPEKATLTVKTGVAGFGVAGQQSGDVKVEGDATIAFASGQITTIDGALTLWGPQATISDASSLTTNSALTGLSTNNGDFSLQGGSKVSVSGSLVNNGYLDVDTQNSGGSTLTIAVALTNNVSLEIGSYGMTGGATVTANSESGAGTIELDGGAAASDLALLNIKTAATAALTSFVELSSYARLEFASGAITSIAANGGIREFGANAVIAIASSLTTNSALKTLSSNAGDIQLDDDATLSISNTLSNSGSISLDGSVEPPSTGGSSLSIAGTLVNSGSIYVGNPGSVAKDKISVNALNNTGTISLSGASTTAQAVMSVASAAGFGIAGVLRGGVSLSGYSSIEFVSGAITQIADNASLTLSGPDAFIEDGVTNSNGALATLSDIAGDLTLNSGAHLSTGALSVTGSVNVGGQSTLAAGATVNYGEITVGGFGLLQVAKITAASLVNDGTLTIEGGAAATEAASVAVASAAGAAGNGVLGGTVAISGYGSLKYASGQIATIANGAYVSLSGPDAFIENATLNANSALEGLSTIAGSLDVTDDVHITTTGGVTVSGTFSVDGGYDDLGGSLVKIGGTLTTNSGATLTLGNPYLTTAVSLSASSLSNSGSLSVEGATGAGHATLTVASAAGFGTVGQLQGTVSVSGDAAIEFASGLISTIASGAYLSLSGASAVIEDGATGTNSALQGLATNNGNVSLNDGAKLTTTGALANNYLLGVDNSYGGGGSNLKIGGLLTNNSSVDIGNYELADDTLVTAASLLNASDIYLYGYKTAQAELAVTGAFTNDGYVGVTNDTETIAGAVSGSGGDTFSLSNSSLVFDSSVDANQTIDFYGADTLTLKRADLFASFVSGFGADDVITATNFVAGTTSSFANDILTLTKGALSAHLHFDGSYVSTDFSVVASASGTTIKFV